eukprot:gene24431-10031_t
MISAACAISKTFRPKLVKQLSTAIPMGGGDHHAEGAVSREQNLTIRGYVPFSTDGAPIISVGSSFSVDKQYSSAEVHAFLFITGDANTLHRDAEQAQAAGFSAPILPGILMASLFPAIIGSNFPGAVYASQSISFKSPALVGQTVTATVTVTKKSGSRLAFSTQCADQDGRVLVDGLALAIMRGEKEQPRSSLREQPRSCLREQPRSSLGSSPEAASESSPEAPSGAAQKLPQGAAQKLPQRAAQKLPQGAAQKLHQRAAQKLPQRAAQKLPQGAAQKLASSNSTSASLCKMLWGRGASSKTSASITQVHRTGGQRGSVMTNSILQPPIRSHPQDADAVGQGGSVRGPCQHYIGPYYWGVGRLRLGPLPAPLRPIERGGSILQPHIRFPLQDADAGGQEGSVQDLCHPRTGPYDGHTRALSESSASITQAHRIGGQDARGQGGSVQDLCQHHTGPLDWGARGLRLGLLPASHWSIWLGGRGATSGAYVGITQAHKTGTLELGLGH